MKKVIEQGDEYDITINIQEGYVSLSQADDLSTDVVIIRPAYTTEAAKAICPKYQETEDENKILKNQIELIFKNAKNKIESLEQKNAKLLEASQQLAEKDKEIEILNARISELNKKTDDLLINIEELSNAIKKSLNK